MKEKKKNQKRKKDEVCTHGLNEELRFKDVAIVFYFAISMELKQKDMSGYVHRVIRNHLLPSV